MIACGLLAKDGIGLDNLFKWISGLFPSSSMKYRLIRLEKGSELPNGQAFNHLVVCSSLGVNGDAIERSATFVFSNGPRIADACDIHYSAFFEESGRIKMIVVSQRTIDSGEIVGYRHSWFFPNPCLTDAKEFRATEAQLLALLVNAGEKRGILVNQRHPLLNRHGFKFDILGPAPWEREK
jgi:hypothetical protein